MKLGFGTVEYQLHKPQESSIVNIWGCIVHMLPAKVGLSDCSQTSMPKQIEDTLLTNYASTRLNAEEKIQLVNIAAQCGKKPSVVLREAFRFYLAQSVLINTQKKRGRMS